MKLCSRCKQEKPFDEFGWRNKDRGWRQAYCRECNRLANSQHYKLNKETYKAKAKQYKKTLLDKKKEYLQSHPCVNCGESDHVVLHFDHVNPNDKVSEISTMIRNGTAWKNILNEIEKCQVLCANCHMRRTAKQFNW